MGIAPAMRELAQSIASSHEERTETVLRTREEARHITEDARVLIKGFQASRGKAGAQLRKDLARDKASRKSDVKRMLADAQASREKEGAQLRKELTQGVAGRRSEVNAMLGDFRSRRKEAGSKLKEELAQSQSSRKSEVAELLKSAQDLITVISESRQDTGKMLRNDLAKGRAERESAVKEMRSEFHKSQAAVRTDINEARAAWQELIRGKPAKKARAKMPPKAEAPKAEEEVVEEEIPDLEAKLLSAINAHPGGITLAEVAESLGVVPVVLGRASRRLLDEGKIRKEDRLYYLVARE